MIPTVMLNQVPDLTFKTGEIAETVLDALKEYLTVYPVVTVAEYRLLANLPVVHDHYKTGWNDLDEARIIYSRGEFMIDFPLASSV